MKIRNLCKIVLFVVLCWAVNAPAANLVPNGDFESGLSGWRHFVGDISITSDAHSGSNACRIEYTGGSEAGANSAWFTVVGGEVYELTSYVKQTAGTGPYKVTIGWFDSEGGWISWDNDWAGYNQPTEYTFHGGTFVAPENAAQCLISLGVSTGVTCLFDEITLVSADLTVVGGTISTNTVWQGEVLVEESVFVEDGVTLTVLPGTHVRFMHYRGYREPEKRLSLLLLGTLIAEGTAAEPIYFTSDAPDPQNGDWSMINLHNSADSIFSYCVIEFGQQGLCVSGGSHEISHCVIRWHNWEGLFFQSYSEPTISYCHIVENGYSGLAAEQFNNVTMEYCEVERNGINGVQIATSTGEIRCSLVHDNLANGLFVNSNGTLRALGIAINDNGWGRGGCGIGFGSGTNIVEVSNLTFSNNQSGDICGPYTTVSSGYMPPGSIDIGFTPVMSYALGYIPGDPDLDGYMYVYPDDETRRIVRKIGEGLGLTQSLAWDGQYIWTATLWGTVSKLEPNTGAVLQQFTAPGPQPWGMTYDGEHLWIVDFAHVADIFGDQDDEFPGDFDRDGDVDYADLFLLTEDWLKETIWHE